MKKKVLGSVLGVLLVVLLAFNANVIFAVPGNCYGSDTPKFYPIPSDGKMETFDCKVGDITWHDLQCCDESYVTIHSCGGKELYLCKDISVPE